MELAKCVDLQKLNDIKEFYDSIEGLEIFELWESAPYFKDEYGQRSPKLAFFPRVKNAKGTFIVCPGGGYTYKAIYEGRTIAEAFNRLGYNTAVLDYRCRPYDMEVTLKDAQRAIRFVRANAEKLGIDTDKVAIGGFSAGGHLSSCAAVHFDLGNPDAEDVVERYSSRPDAAILCYGNISQLARLDVSEDDPRYESLKRYSPEYWVKPDTPPMYMWMTRSDQLLSPAQLYKMAMALDEEKVLYEVHVFDKGPHGMGLCDGSNPDPIVPVDPHVGLWVQLADEWMLRTFE